MTDIIENNTDEEEITLKVTDLTEKTCYTLPLSPQDLVAIYKDKGEDGKDEDYILWVDYANSRLKLSAQHIMIYLANTNFKTTFSGCDEDLLLAYIKSDFLVDCPMLARVLTNIIKVKFRHELAPLEKELFNVFDEEAIYKFIENNGDLLDEVVENVRSVIPYTLTKILENLPEEQRTKEVQLEETVADIKATDDLIQSGPNVPMLVGQCWDVFLVVVTYTGLSMEYNKHLYNDKPKYFGKDLFFVLNHSNVVSNIVQFFPPDFFETDHSPEE